MRPGSRRFKPTFIVFSHAALIVVLSALAYRQYGFAGPLTRDDAIYLYSGQQMARGIPPYLGIWDHKGPLAPMIAGVGAWVAPWLGIEDPYGMFTIIACHLYRSMRYSHALVAPFL